MAKIKISIAFTERLVIFARFFQSEEWGIRDGFTVGARKAVDPRGFEKFV